MPKHNIIPKMFDIRPTNEAGGLDLERVKNLEHTIKLERRKTAAELALLKGALWLQKKEVVPRMQDLGIKKRAQRLEVLGPPSRKPQEIMLTKPMETEGELSQIDGVLGDLDSRFRGDNHVRTEDIHSKKLQILNPQLQTISAGLEGHNFLPSREEILRELAIIEERDRKLTLLSHLTRELERDLQSKPSSEAAARSQVTKRPTTQASASHPEIRARSFVQQLAPFKIRLPKLTLAHLQLPTLALSPPRFTRRSLPVFVRRSAFAMLGILLLGGAIFGKLKTANVAASMRAEGLVAYGRMLDGLHAALERDFVAAQGNFADAYNRLRSLGGGARLAGKSLALISDAFSFSSETASNVHILEAAEKFAKAGEQLSQYAALFSQNGIGSLTPKEFITGYLSDADLRQAKELLAVALENLNAARQDLAKVDVETLPVQFQEGVKTLQEKIPAAITVARQFANFQDALFDVFGYIGPRKYLIIFQNSAELRPTGGFIGSYALIDILDGKITKLFIDDVFNIDGQLVDRVVPPTPIQKISTAWSLHDANWFFDYPTSAKKISRFYEKTGGASVDGVIAVTPVFLEQFFDLVGHVSLPAYGVELTKENFRDELSYLIEEGTPKKEGASPKIVLRDLGTLLFDMVSEKLQQEGLGEMLKIFTNALEKRDVQLWVRNTTVEEFLVKQQWGGAIRASDGDFLAVVHTNINGYKTDRVIQEEISHRAAVSADGSIIDTVTITRTHYGSPLERYAKLYQKVNADYLRVYVPSGSHLIAASGYTAENGDPPIDYAQARFTIDPEVHEVESSLRTHYPSGTHIMAEGGKTVFGNWVYVSPGEKVVVQYTYKLPWKIALDGTGTYSMLVQKQPGVERAVFNGHIAVTTEGVAPEGAPTNVPFDRDIEYSITIK